MSNQVVGPRLLGAIALVTLFAACSPQVLDRRWPSAARSRQQRADGCRRACADPGGHARLPTMRGLPDFADLVARGRFGGGQCAGGGEVRDRPGRGRG